MIPEMKCINIIEYLCIAVHNTPDTALCFKLFFAIFFFS